MSCARRVIPLILIAVSLAAVPATAAATDADRPKVGLVLGGGGARGAAHVGVLQELERLQVPIDAIAGTSVGAIVGGLYASGLTAHEIENVIASLDWSQLLSDRPHRQDLSFRRRLDDEAFPIDLEVGYGSGRFRLPKGVIQGHHMDHLLRGLLLHVAPIEDFDALPVPFRAVGTDLERGEPYVIDSGNLARAILASMSVPGAFAPVEIDGRLLTDGGLVGNLPIDAMQSMDVDVIIAVDVEFPLYSKAQLESVVDISEQLLTIVVRRETLRQIEKLADDDILIRPELETFPSTGFSAALDVVQHGADAARAVEGKLVELSVSADDYSAYAERRTARTHQPKTVGFVRLVDKSGVPDAVLEQRLGLEAGDAMTAESLGAAVDRLHGLKYFDKVAYRLVEENGATGVEFRTFPRTWGPGFLRFGIALEDDFEGSTAVNVGTRFVRPGLNSLGGELLADLRIGTDPRFAVEWYQPFASSSRLFVSPRLSAGQRNASAFQSGDPVARLRVTEAELGFDAGFELGRAAEFRLGIFRGTGDVRVKVGDPAIPGTDFETGGGFASLRFDTRDDAQFPKHGARGGLHWTANRRGLGADENFDTLEFELGGAWTRGRNTVSVGLDYRTSLDDVAVLANQFPLGGFLRLSGLERGQVVGPHAGLLRGQWYREIGESASSLVQMPFYVGASVEAGNAWQSRDEIDADSLLINGSLFLGLDTPFGPLYLAAGIAEGGRSNFYLFIGSPPR